MARKTGGEAVVDSLIANDVEVVFGLPGAQLDPLFAAFHDRQDKIRIIHSRHEQGCAYMAYGYAEASGKLGTCLVVPGPGMLNAGAAIVTAYACNTPVLWLVGQGRTPLIGKGFGVLHEIPDQFETARTLVKSADRVTHPSNATWKIADSISKIREEIGEHGVLVSDLTQLYFAAQDAFPVYNPRTYVHPSYQGTLGHAAATVLGAKVAVPDQPVVCVAGDGGFMFTINELITAVQYKIGAIFIVMNDGAYGNVKRIMNKNYDGRVICADLENPDFIKLAEAFGMPGRKADTADTLRIALRESINEGGPALIEFEAGEFPDPWHLHFRPKVRGG